MLYVEDDKAKHTLSVSLKTKGSQTHRFIQINSYVLVLLKRCPIEYSRISWYWWAFQLGSYDQPTQQNPPFMDLIRNSRGSVLFS